jgi:hypothetical protein
MASTAVLWLVLQSGGEFVRDGVLLFSYAIWLASELVGSELTFERVDMVLENCPIQERCGVHESD